MILWFMLLVLVPMIIVTWFGSKKSSEAFLEFVDVEISQTNKNTHNFIENWFQYRFMDLASLSANPRNAELVGKLHTDLLSSGLSFKAFIKSIYQ